jgi:hypothetical protein
MLLHNQRGAAISWEANGQVYAWAPYGACELPDVYVPLIKSQGFPVDVVPVPPKEKAERHAALATEAEAAQEAGKLRKALESAEALVLESKSAAEAADIRAADVRAELEKVTELLRTREEELRVSRGEAAECGKLLTEATAEIAKLKEQLALEQAKSATSAAPAKPKAR